MFWSGVFAVLVLTISCFGKSTDQLYDIGSIGEKVTKVDAPNGRLNIFVLPTGQGDSNVIQCPNGDLTVFDLGQGFATATSQGFWMTADVRNYFSGNLNRVINIVISHNHWDHYSFLPSIFPDRSDMPNLRNIYHSCTRQDFPSTIANWVNNGGFQSYLTDFNNGRQCGYSGGSCGSIDLCPGTSISADVLSANAGSCSSNINIDSIVLQIQYGSVKILIMGDFEDETTNWNENGPQKALVDFYGSSLQSTIYIVAHHGATNLANKPVLRDAIAPKAIVTSGDPWFGYGHPRCNGIEAFYLFVRSLCKPLVGSSDPSYCGGSFTQSSTRLQSTYTCGLSSTNMERVNNNDWAIYSAAPLQFNPAFISITTNGNIWQIDAEDI